LQDTEVFCGSLNKRKEKGRHYQTQEKVPGWTSVKVGSTQKTRREREKKTRKKHNGRRIGRMEKRERNATDYNKKTKNTKKKWIKK
jgi:hypothetical protein